jgi:hypothetical protein
MEIKFKQIDEKHIDIISNENIIGHIFTPSDTLETEEHAIQICGFDKLFDYMGCGVFGDGKGNAKKDVQLWFNENSRMDSKVADVIRGDCCYKCFHKKENCICEEFKLDLKHKDIIKEEIIKEL